jgi:hypothetical protein
VRRIRTREVCAAFGFDARARRAVALLAVALAVGPACGGDSPAAGRRLSVSADRVYGGTGDQVAPALGDGHLAYVDYPDGVGCAETGACRGHLVVTELTSDAVVFRTDVGPALPALGEGFVAWMEIREPATTHRGAIYLRRFGDAGTAIHRLSERDETVETRWPPVADGRFVAWYSPYGTPRGVRVRDVESGLTQTIETSMGADFRGLALHRGTLAFVDRSTATWQEEIVIVDLESGETRRLDVASDFSGRRLMAPVLAEGYLAYKIVPPAHCVEACPTTVSSRILTPNGHGASPALDLESETVSRYGPLLVSNASVLWLDVRDGPYALYGTRLDGSETEAVRLTPDEARLPWIAPAAAQGRNLAWVDGRDGSLDVHLGQLR